MSIIKEVLARQVLDSRGNPTIEAEVHTAHHSGRAIVPSGASKGVHEAVEVRDGGKAFDGLGVQKAVKSVGILKKALVGRSVTRQQDIDRLMIQLDKTKNKKRFGANSILAISLASARAAAKEDGEHLFQHLRHIAGTKFKMPVPYMNVINGGLHADNKLDFQEYMMVPQAKTFSEALRIGTEVYHELKEVLHKKGLITGVGDEGGFAPDIRSYEEPLKLITEAARELGYEKKVKLAIDCAASDIMHHGKYFLRGRVISSSRLFAVYEDLISRYPIISIEDPFHEEDFNAFQIFTKRFGKKINVVGDDLLVTNVERITKALAKEACNTLLLKVNQIGTLTEAISAAKLAFRNDWKVIVSHRSGDTEDPFIADLAVALGCGMIKAGAPCRGERTAKYNQLLRIEELL